MNITIVKRPQESPAMSRSRIIIALSAGITSLSLAGAASAEDAGQDPSGAVYVLLNQSTANSVLVYRRDSNGNLTYSSSVPTGGTGAGTGGDPLGSKGSLALAACRTQVSVFVRADNSITRGDDWRIHGGCP